MIDGSKSTKIQLQKAVVSISSANTLTLVDVYTAQGILDVRLQLTPCG